MYIDISIPDPQTLVLITFPVWLVLPSKSVGRPRDRDPAILQRYHFVVHFPPVHLEYSMNLEQVFQ